MAEHTADFEWRGEGEDAELVLYASSSGVAGEVFEQALSAARLPGVISPVYAAASWGTPGVARDLGWVAASETHVAPDLASTPELGLLLVADTPVAGVEVPEEMPRLISRRLSEVALPDLRSEAEVRRVSESGAFWAADEGLIEEEDLAYLSQIAGDSDSLSRRSLSAGLRDWTRPGAVGAFRVAEVLSPEEAGEIGIEAGALAFVVSTGAEDLGRLALAGHRERILARTTSGDFGAPPDLPAAPLDTEEARDLLAAASAVSNYATGRAALILYALRRALEHDAGPLYLRTAWTVGGFEERDEMILHRNHLAAAGAGEALVSGPCIAAGTGAMLWSAPPFEAPEEDGRWPWEEAGILERWAVLDPL